MITENDIQAGVTLKYLGGHIAFDCSFTVGKLYKLYTDLYDNVVVDDDEKDERSLVLDSFELWERYYTVSKPSNEISLALSKDEAQMLADVLACVGGCPELSRRKFVNGVINKLKSFNITYNRPEYADQVDLSGTINCKTIFEPIKEAVKETVEYNGSIYDKIEFDNMLANLEKL